MSRIRGKDTTPEKVVRECGESGSGQSHAPHRHGNEKEEPCRGTVWGLGADPRPRFSGCGRPFSAGLSGVSLLGPVPAKCKTPSNRIPLLEDEGSTKDCLVKQ